MLASIEEAGFVVELVADCQGEREGGFRAQPKSFAGCVGRSGCADTLRNRR